MTSLPTYNFLTYEEFQAKRIRMQPDKHKCRPRNEPTQRKSKGRNIAKSRELKGTTELLCPASDSRNEGNNKHSRVIREKKDIAAIPDNNVPEDNKKM